MKLHGKLTVDRATWEGDTACCGAYVYIIPGIMPGHFCKKGFSGSILGQERRRW